MRLVILCGLLIVNINCFSQSNNNPNSLEGTPFADRLYFGGDLGLNFGNYTIVNVAPFAGYRVNKLWSIGSGIKYTYLSYRDPYSPWSYQSSIYGGSVFTRYLVGEQFLLHAEFESLNTEVWELFASESSRKWVPMGFVGAGFRQGSGGTYVQILALYDLIDDRFSPYKGQYLLGPDIPLIVRGGIVIGL